MAITKTTLSAAITNNQLQFGITSATNFTVGRQVKVDNEYIGAITAVSGTTITVRGRGDQGTAGVAHAILAPIEVGDAADWPIVTPGNVNEIPPSQDDFLTIGADGAIAVPVKNTTVEINKATAIAATLGDPSKASDGIQLTVVAGTAVAHVVVNTTGFNAGGTTVDTATFGGAIGDNFTATALSGTWVITNAINVTLGLWMLMAVGVAGLFI